MANKVIVKAPAKINLFLDVLNKRDDGYHNVNMVMQSVTLFDTVVISKTEERGINLNFPKQEFLCSNVNIEKNTAFLAANEFFKAAGIDSYGIKITIFKNIPICAGLAGGSSDAAAVLVGINNLFNTKLSKIDLYKLGKKIGADVPFCIFGGTMLAKDTGTSLAPLNHMPFCYMVLCKPSIRVSTKKAYEACDGTLREAKKMNNILCAIRKKRLKYLAKCTFNSFEEVLNLRPVKKIKNFMLKNGAMTACMSGSGPTVYGIFYDKYNAIWCQRALKKWYSDVFLCQPQKFGSKIISIE